MAKENGTLSVNVFGGGGGNGGAGGDRRGMGGRFGDGGQGGGGGGGLSFGGTNLRFNATALGGVGGAGGDPNANGGRGGDGVDFTNSGTGRLINGGNIVAGAGGIGLYSGAGGDGVYFGGSSAVLDNSGAIVGGPGGVAIGNAAGAGGDGVHFSGGNSVLNNSGRISGGAGGKIDPDYQSLSGAGGAAVSFGGYGSSVNNSGSIKGGTGGPRTDMYRPAGKDGAAIEGANLTVKNTGLIIGGNSGKGDAITFTGGVLNNLYLTNRGPNLADGLVGGLGVTGVLFLHNTAASNSISNTIHDASGGKGSIVYGDGKVLTLSGKNTYSGGTTIAGGTLRLSLATSAGTGAITFSAPSTLALSMAAQKIGGTFGNTLADFGAGDAFDLKGLKFSVGATAVYDPAGHLLTVTTSGKTEKFTLSDVPDGTTYYAHSDKSGGTLVDTKPGVGNPVCFARGTLIRTSRGEVAVESLRVGDRVETASGVLRPIIWLGHRTLGTKSRRAGAPAFLPAHLCPVRIRAGGFGVGSCGSELPTRDLTLSPGHPVRVGKGAVAHLVPIMCLINGTSIERVPVETIEYWHVELDAHDLLLAEGLAAESYFDWGDRPFFEEGSDHALSSPDFVVPGLARRCLPVALDGPIVGAERRRLDALFAMALEAQCTWPQVEDPAFLF